MNSSKTFCRVHDRYVGTIVKLCLWYVVDEESIDRRGSESRVGDVKGIALIMKLLVVDRGVIRRVFQYSCRVRSSFGEIVTRLSGCNSLYVGCQLFLRVVLFKRLLNAAAPLRISGVPKSGHSDMV